MFYYPIINNNNNNNINSGTSSSSSSFDAEDAVGGGGAGAGGGGLGGGGGEGGLGDEPAGPILTTYNNRLGDPEPIPVSALSVAAETSPLLTCAEVDVGDTPRMSALAPVTKPVDMLVPESVRVEFPSQSERI